MLTALIVIAVILTVVLYFAPSIVAYVRNVPNQASVIVINVLLGWTLVGWVVALAMAVRTVPELPPAGRPQLHG